MPSYHLTSKMNLGDVEDIYKSKSNLNIGPFVEQDSNNIFITNGSIQVNDFILTSNITPNLYLKYDKGTTTWSEPPVNYWAQTNISNVSLAGFCNDIQFVYRSNLAPFTFTSYFFDLSNEPTVSDIIPHDKKSNILRANCNLSELTNSSQALDTIYSNLELKALAFKNASLTTIRDITILENFYIFGNCNQVGNLLKATERIDLTEYDTSLTNWYDVFYDSYSNLRDIFILINSHSNNSTTSSVTSSTLSNIYNELNEIIFQKQGFTDQEIEILMSERMSNGEFLIKTFNLQDIFQIEECHSNLELGDLALDTNSNSITNANSFIINNSLYWDNSIQIYTYSNQEVYLTTSNNLGSISLNTLPLATNSNKGMVLINSNITISNYTSSNIFLSNEVINSYTQCNIHNDVQNTLSNLQSTVYYTFPDFNHEGLIHFLDNQLSQFSDFPNIRPTAYSNLKLEKVSYTSDYHDLITAPTTLLPFSNDIGFLLRDMNGQEYNNINLECRNTLLCGDISTQNRHKFNIINGNANLTDITVYDKFTYNTSQINVNNKWLRCIDSSNLLWEDLHKATTEILGAVKQLETYTIADYEATVNAKSFNDMYNYFDSNIYRIEQKMKLNGIY